MKSQSLFPEFIESTAQFDDSERYRYRLFRRWAEYGGGIGPIWHDVCLWVMLNPSTADAFVLDPTIKRCVNFSKAWGFHALEVVNLFAFRATHPDDMIAAADPIGPENDKAIFDAAQSAARIVVAWGRHGRIRGRSQQVLDLLKPTRLYALGTCENDEPKHPLYVDGETPLVVYRQGY